MPRVDEVLLWRCGDIAIRCGEGTLVMGVLNVTPDSFSDGGRYGSPADAVAEGLRMVADGADILDVGGESTRPGSEPVSESEELSRVIPVIEGLAGASVPISIDTRKPGVARAALAAGAVIVNDVGGARDPDMFGVIRETGAGLVLMHMLGEPGTMQENPTYHDVVEDVKAYLRERVESAVFAGIAADRIAVDPGIGFGKTVDQNLALLRGLASLGDLRCPILVGPSRKRFIGAILDDAPVGERLEGTAGAVAWLAAIGADIVRVHDVREMVRVVRVVDAIVRARP